MITNNGKEIVIHCHSKFKCKESEYEIIPNADEAW